MIGIFIVIGNKNTRESRKGLVYSVILRYGGKKAYLYSNYCNTGNFFNIDHSINCSVEKRKCWWRGGEGPTLVQDNIGLALDLNTLREEGIYQGYVRT